MESHESSQYARQTLMFLGDKPAFDINWCITNKIPIDTHRWRNIRCWHVSLCWDCGINCITRQVHIMKIVNRTSADMVHYQLDKTICAHFCHRVGQLLVFFVDWTKHHVKHGATLPKWLYLYQLLRCVHLNTVCPILFA